MGRIEKICILNFIFKIMAAVGTLSIIGLAMISDYGDITNASLFLHGLIWLAVAGIGVWGMSNCSRFIESYKSRQRRLRARAAEPDYVCKAA